MLDTFRDTFPRSLASSLVMFTSVACAFATAGSSEGIKAVIEMCASLASNITANDLYKIIADRINHQDILVNGNLARAQSDAILATITATAQKPEYRRVKTEILLLIENTSDRLQQLLHGEAIANAGAARQSLSRLSDADFIRNIFSANPQNFPHQPSTISVAGWEELVMWLAIEKHAVMSPQTTRAIATDLHHDFPRVFLEVINEDFSKGGRAYAVLQHRISNALVSGLKEIFAAVSVVSQQVANVDQKVVAVRRDVADVSEQLGRIETMFAQFPEVAQELKSLLQTYEAAAAQRTIFEQSQKELQIFKLKEALQEHLQTVLYEDANTRFFRKYVHSAIYFERQEAEIKFHDFLAQTEERCFVAIAKAGMGKTCLLCRLAESLTFNNSQFLPLLIGADSLELTVATGNELSTGIVERIQVLAPLMPESLTLKDLGKFLKENELGLVVFVDGLNELQGNDPYTKFNAQFGSLLDLVVEQNLPVYFALTCRSGWWQYFNANRWTENNIFQKHLETQATVVLEPPSEKETKLLSEKYFDYFAIRGELKGEALRTCQTLLMLRLLCDAYTNRPVNDKSPKTTGIKPRELREISSFKKKEILKSYVASRRESFVEFVRHALYGTDALDTTPSNIYNLTTLYIINIANFMYQKRGTSITTNELFQIAETLKHPDAALGREQIAASSRSFFQRLIDLGIFNRNEKNAQEFSFVYETYFEFSLGRYIAFVWWPEITKGTLDHSIINRDLDNLVGEHNRLSRDRNFSNLFGAVQFAVLATEAGDWIDWKHVPAEESVYRERPRLFGQLVSRLSETKEGFDWQQQACAIIRESELAKRESWERFSGQNGDRSGNRERFGELLKALDKLADTTDFVLLWDIENTLKTLAQANLGLTFDHLSRWAESNNSLKTVFAAQVISALAVNYPDEVLDLLVELMRNEKLRSNFWIMRSLLFAASEFTRANHQSDLENNSSWRRLRAEVYKLLARQLENGMWPYIASRALSLLPDLSLSQDAELQRIDEFIEQRLQESQSWQLLNLVFNLPGLPDAHNPSVEAWIFRTLDKLASHNNHHLLYGIERMLDSVGNRRHADPATSAISVQIKDKLKGRLWRTNVEPEVHSRERTDQIGIVYTPKYLEPDYENHIECRERLVAILNKLEACGEENFVWITPREASIKELEEKVHNIETDRHRDGSKWSDYIETIKQASVRINGCRKRIERSGPSELRFESFEVAKMAAGGVIKGIDYVIRYEAPVAFVLCRPPGHLANNTICIFNNIAVGADYALAMPNVQRILIVDCDAHHGKHTQKVFYRSPDVIYFSMHIDGDYAREDGMIKDIGDGPGEGYTFNIPYPPMMGDDGYRFIIDRLLVPVALDFKPDLILLSAGFDGHFDDPLTPACLLTDEAYIHLAQSLKKMARRNNCKIVGALEGGYGLESMSNSLAHMLNVWGEWNLKDKIGFTRKPEGYENSVDPKALETLRQLVTERIEIMHETKRLDDSYFFNPSAPHWSDECADLPKQGEH